MFAGCFFDPTSNIILLPSNLAPLHISHRVALRSDFDTFTVLLTDHDGNPTLLGKFGSLSLKKFNDISQSSTKLDVS